MMEWLNHNYQAIIAVGIIVNGAIGSGNWFCTVLAHYRSKSRQDEILQVLKPNGNAPSER
jgi:uncharacterized membrane protein